MSSTQRLHRERALEAEVARLRERLAERGKPEEGGTIEDRYRLAARATNDAIWDWNLRSDRVEWNEALQAAYGHAPEDVEPTGAWWIAQIHPEDRARVDRSIHAVIGGTATRWSTEYRFRRADGSFATVLDRGFVMRDAAGEPVRMIGAMLDLSDRKQAEAALRRSEDRLRMATAAAGIGTFDYLVQCDELSWDDQCRALFGVPPGAPVTYRGTFLAGLHPEDRARVDEAVRRAFDPAGTGIFDIEYRTIGLTDGLQRWISARGEAVFEEGTATRFIGMVLDIGERRRAESRLRELNDRLEQLVAERTLERDRIWNASQDLLGVADSEGVWRSVNPAWTAALGWREEEIVGRTSAWLEHPEDREPTRAAVAQLAQGRRMLGYENRFRTRGGAYRRLSWVAVPVEGMLYCSARDVTEQHLAAAQLARTEEELRQSQKMEAVGQLTGGLAHDFNNLLAGISGSLELLQAAIDRGQAQNAGRYIGAAQNAVMRAAALTHRLLAFSRRQTLDPKPIAISALIAGMDELIRRTVGPAIVLEIDCEDGLWATLVDPPQLENALLNLCINARDAMPDGGRLRIQAGNLSVDGGTVPEHHLPVGEYVALCVTDTGTGMAPEITARAFEPFFTTKPLGQGTGLGLSMIYGFVRQSGGEVRIRSAPGHGTAMTLYLPRHHGAAQPVMPSPADDLAHAPRASSGETVMVVDDEPTVRMLVVEVLRELGYAAIEAGDAPEGLRLLQSGARIDLLVTDVGLPGGMNGRQLADAARTSRPDLKVLFITGYAENAVMGGGRLDPGMHIMTKPFALEALANRIRTLLADGG